jgi:ubiquitin-like 1-activating enzyme E1 A
MSSKTVSNEEAELYDRQIRLWGLEAQTRMQSCKVLVVGLRGVHTEVKTFFISRRRLGHYR